MDRLKIALVCDWYLPRIGGVEIHLQALAQQLAAEGHEVHVITTTPAGGPEAAGPYTIRRLKTPLLPPWKVTFSLRMASRVRAILAQENYDIVHAHSIYSPLACIAVNQAAKIGIPSIFTNHSLTRDLGLLSILCRFIYRRWLNRASLLTAVSSACAIDTQNDSGRSGVTVLHNGIHTADWAIPKRKHAGLRVTSVMRLSPRKRPLALLEAIPEIVRAVPAELQVCFTIVGDGPLRKKMGRLIDRLNLQRHVELLGYQPRSEIINILSRSDVFVLPSESEALSIAILEACSSGLPVVGMNHGGVDDIIQTGSNGLLAGDRHEFVRHILTLIRDRELRIAMGQAAQKTVENFQWPQITREHLSLYRAVIEKHADAAAI